ncbi:MAG: glycosyl hydrolase family 28 protein, partial [Bacteroidales bacterium]
LDAGSWSIEPIACDSVIIRNVKVISDLRLYGSKINTDGIDPNKCRHVLVEDCLIWCGDDAITPKQDNTFNSDFPLRNVFNHTYRNIITYTPKSAIKIGSETMGPGKEMYNMTFENFDVVYADRAICIWSEEGAIINYITFKDFNIEKISDEYKKSHIHCWIDKNGNSIKNLKFINIHAKEPAPGGSSFIGNNLNAMIDGKRVQYYNIHFSNYTIAGEPVLSLTDPNAKFNLRENFNTYADSSAFTFDGGDTIVNGGIVGQKSFDSLIKIKVSPNPFSAACQIDFTLKKNEHVKLFIRNISGQVVKTIYDNYLPLGSHSVKWNSELENSGIYLVSLWTEKYQHTVKVYKM